MSAPCPLLTQVTLGTGEAVVVHKEVEEADPEEDAEETHQKRSRYRGRVDKQQQLISWRY